MATACQFFRVLESNEGVPWCDFPPPPPDNRIADFGTDFRLRSAKPAVVERALAEAEKAAAAAEAKRRRRRLEGAQKRSWPNEYSATLSAEEEQKGERRRERVQQRRQWEESEEEDSDGEEEE